MGQKRYFLMISLLILIGIFVLTWLIQIVGGKMPFLDIWMQGVAALYFDTPIYFFFRWVTELGSRHVVQPFTIMMVFVLWILYRNWRPAFIFGVGVLGTHVLNSVIKLSIARERPSISVILNAEGYSYPSGHAMVSLVCYGLLAYFLSQKMTSKKWATFTQFGCVLLIFLIGLSRPFLNVHYLSDIVTGFFIGFLCLIGFIRLYEFLCLRNQ